MTLPWAGFHPLRKGRIHVFCPRCHRKVSNAFRGEYDPPRSTLVHEFCDKCGAGGKDCYSVFYDAKGKQISGEECERVLDAALKAKGID